jgi:hypothetical protein
MSDHDSVSDTSQDRNQDGVADAFAVIAIITIVVVTAVFWLSGMH